MAEEIKTDDFGEIEKAGNNVYGRIPNSLELLLSSFCAGGAVVNYKRNNSNTEEIACLQVPTQNGRPMRVMVTLGNEESVASGLKNAVYHVTGIENIIGGGSNDK